MSIPNSHSPYPKPRKRNLEPPLSTSGSSHSSVDAKVVVMGNAGVGKTSLVCRYTHGVFLPASTTSTTGATFQAKKTIVDGVSVRLQLWDTAGQERFRSMAPMYYRGAHAAILVYDITDLKSFKDLKSWLEELKKNTAEDMDDMTIYIVGAKADLSSQRAVTTDRARALLKQWFPPPQAPTSPSTSLVSFYSTGYPFNSTSLYPHISSALTRSVSTTLSNSMSIPQHLTTLSTQLPALPTMPSFNLPRPKFPSLPSSRNVLTISVSPLSPAVEEDVTPASAAISTPGTSATSNNTILTTNSVSTSTDSSSVHRGCSLSPPLPLPAPLRTDHGPSITISPSYDTPFMSDLGLNVNMSGSGYSGFTRAQGSAVVPSGSRLHNSATGSSASDSSTTKGNLVRRNTSGFPSITPISGNHSSNLAPGIKRSNSSRSAVARLAASRAHRDETDIDIYDSHLRHPQRPAFRPGQQDPSTGHQTYHDEDVYSRAPFSARTVLTSQEPDYELSDDTDDRSATEPTEAGEDEQLAWGFSKDMRLFEVSSKDGDGVQELFVTLLQAVIKRRHVIDQQRRLRERDSVTLEPAAVPSWGSPVNTNGPGEGNPLLGGAKGNGSIHSSLSWGGSRCCAT